MKRFLDKVDKQFRGCWEWKATRAGKLRHYGYFWINKKFQYAHRASYELYVGKIPKGKYVLHRCDNTICVRPSHLFLGTQKDNMRDMLNKGRRVAPKGEANKGGGKLKNRDIMTIRSLYKPYQYTQKRLSKEFDVSEVMINRILNNLAWTHI